VNRLHEKETSGMGQWLGARRPRRGQFELSKLRNTSWPGIAAVPRNGGMKSERQRGNWINLCRLVHLPSYGATGTGGH
jgi:hypothetical protein